MSHSGRDAASTSPGAVDGVRGRLVVHVRRHWPLWVMLAVLAALYARTASYPFVNWDDPLHVYRNPAILEPAELTWSERWMPRQLGYPMPVTMLSYRIDRWLVGGRTPLPPEAGAVFHRTNLLLAAALVLLLYALLTRFVQHRWAVLLGGLFFVAHPLIAEPVSWISGRKDLLAAVFSLAALLAWHSWLAGRRWTWLAAFVALALLALGSKPNAVYLVALAPLLWWRLQLAGPHLAGAQEPEQVQERSNAAGAAAAGRSWAGVLALVLLAGVGIALAVVAWRWNRTVGGVEARPALETLRRAGWALGFHFGLVLLPFELLPKYIVTPGALSLYDVGGVLAAAGLVWLALARRRRADAALVVGAALCLASYLPNSSLIPLRRFLADSYMLLPLAGLALLLGGALQRAGRLAALGWSLRVATSVLLLMFATVTVSQVPLWRSSVALWSTTRARYPRSPRVCRMLGHAYSESGELRRAVVVYQRCARRFGLELVANNLGVTYFVLGADAEAERVFRWILARRPDDRRARKYLRLIRARRSGRSAPGGP